jgi:hypothetical protein
VGRDLPVVGCLSWSGVRVTVGALGVAMTITVRLGWSRFVVGPAFVSVERSRSGCRSGIKTVIRAILGDSLSLGGKVLRRALYSQLYPFSLPLQTLTRF